MIKLINNVSFILYLFDYTTNETNKTFLIFLDRDFELILFLS